MRILLVHQGYPPTAQGGSELYTAALARTLACAHEVAVLHRVRDPERVDHEVRAETRDGVRVFSMNNLHRVVAGFESYRDPEAAAAAAPVMDETRPDLVHVGSLEGLSTGIVFEARRRGTPVVLTLHDFGPACPLGQLLDRRLRVCPGPEGRRCLACVGEQVAPGPAGLRPFAARVPFASALGRSAARLSGAGASRIEDRLAEMREVCRGADLVIAPSRFMKDRMEAALGISGIRVLEHGHEPLRVPPRSADPKGRVRFGFLGAAVPSKGLHVLAEAFRLLGDPRAALRVHGAFTPYHGDTGYEAQVRALLGPHARESLLGPFAHDRLGDVLAGLDVIVVPSIWEENSPLVVQEAFLARLPLVVAGHGALAEKVRDGIDGLSFRPGDAADLSRVLRRLLDEPGLRQRLGRTPPHVPSMEEHAAALHALYVEARDRRGRRAGRVGVVVLDREDPAGAVAAARSAQQDGIAAVVIVQNGPGPAGTEAPDIERLCLPENLGYAGGMNAGIRHLRAAGCDRFLLLNNDAAVEPGCVWRLAEALEDAHLAAVGPVVLREADRRVESRGGRFDPGWGGFRLLGAGEPLSAREGRVDVQSLSGAAWMVKGSALDRVGMLEESYFFSFEETDWCARARAAGLRLAVVLGARARHAGGGTLASASPERLYYASRNHLRAVERLRPLPPAARWLRRVVVVALNLAHAARQDAVPRLVGMQAVLAGAADFWRGRAGPRERRT